MPQQDLLFPEAEKLLSWYDKHARILPWRLPPHLRKNGVTANPYLVWLSEIMLQQTTVATVKAYFEKFTILWPTLPDLAKTDREDILKAWAGLGYYSRARNLKACADKIMNDYDGIFPNEEKELKKLPGIGDYTSAAIAAIAFDKPATVVDGNVERVIARLFKVETPLPIAKKEIKKLAKQLTPQNRPGDYAQAMMDLGATICTPKRPACSLCVWNKNCRVFKTGMMEEYPKKMPKTKKPTRYGIAYIAIRSHEEILLQKRPEKGLLAGMSAVPNTEWLFEKSNFTPDFPPPSSAPLPFDDALHCGSIKHTFTHFHLIVEVYKKHFEANIKAPPNGWWSSFDKIKKEALPTVMKKMISKAEPEIF